MLAIEIFILIYSVKIIINPDFFYTPALGLIVLNNFSLLG